MFGAVLVAGPRQVGKTTMLERLTSNIGYVTLDDPIVRTSAEEESGTFFKDNPPPVFVDEIQKAPALFEQIKLYLDRERKKGQFFMCGSQQFKMMKGVIESLAGRIGLVTLLGFSLREAYGIECDTPFLPTEEYFAERKGQLADISYDDVWNRIHRGSMPELHDNPDFNWQMFYGAYVRTYIDRDVRELSEIGDTVKFTQKNPYKFIITGRIKHFINAFGEELIIDNAEKGLAKACEATGAQVLEYSAAPVFMDSNAKCRHQWLIEFNTMPDSLEKFRHVLDKSLQEANSDYEAKRHKDITLQELEIIVARPNLFHDWLKQKGKLGGQHKIPRLSNNRDYIEEMLKLNK